MKFLMYAPHNWNTTELLYEEQVVVKDGYGVTTKHTSPANMRARGYDPVCQVEDDDPRTLDELIRDAQHLLGHQPLQTTMYAAPLGNPGSPYQDGHGNPAPGPTH